MSWWEEVTYWKRPWCWERLKAGREEGDRGWDGWMASLMQWTWTCANSRWWWGPRKLGMLQSMRSWKVGHDVATEQQQRFQGRGSEMFHVYFWWAKLLFNFLCANCLESQMRFACVCVTRFLDNACALFSLDVKLVLIVTDRPFLCFFIFDIFVYLWVPVATMYLLNLN